MGHKEKDHASDILITLKDQRISQQRSARKACHDTGSIPSEDLIHNGMTSRAGNLSTGNDAPHAMPHKEYALMRVILLFDRMEIPAQLKGRERNGLAGRIQETPELIPLPKDRICLKPADDFTPSRLRGEKSVNEHDRDLPGIVGLDEDQVCRRNVAAMGAWRSPATGRITLPSRMDCCTSGWRKRMVVSQRPLRACISATTVTGSRYP